MPHYSDDPEWQRLYAAVCRDPLDDAVRLAVADWLDERPTAYRQCPACTDRKVLQQSPDALNNLRDMLWKRLTCPTCEGSMEVPDPEAADRAALIRNQIRLEACDPEADEWFGLSGTCKTTVYRYGLRWISRAEEARTRFATQITGVAAHLAGADVMIGFRRGFAEAIEFRNWDFYGAAVKKWATLLPLTAVTFGFYNLRGYSESDPPRLWVNNIAGQTQTTTRGQIYLPAEFGSLLKGGRLLHAYADREYETAGHAYADREYETAGHAYADLSQAMVRYARACAGLPDIELPYEPMESS